MKKLKNAFLTCICHFTPLKKHVRTNELRVLLVSTTGLGDTLWATPAIESLRKSYPKSYLCVLTSGIGKEALKNNPHIDQIYTLDRSLVLSFFSLRKKLFKERFDTCLILHSSQRLVVLLSALIGATNVIGTRGINKGLDNLLTTALPPIYEHEILRRLRQVEEIGGIVHTETLSYFGIVKGGKREKKIILHPGSKDGFKRWPINNFIRVGEKLNQEGFSIIISGTHQEQSLTQKIAQQIPNAKYLEIRSLQGFAKELNESSLLISNDTGSVHLACAINSPLIAIYGPTDPVLCGTHQAQCATMLSVKPTCRPCIKRKCLEPFCLRQIGVDEVIATALKELALTHS